MRKWALGLAVGLVLFTGVSSAADKKFAVVDVQKAMRSADKVKEIESKLKKEFSAEQKKIVELLTETDYSLALTPRQGKVLSRISLCRTAYMGGLATECNVSLRELSVTFEN